MKKNIILLILTIGLALLSCSTKPAGDDIVKKRITQYIDVNGMGLLKDLEVTNIQKINDSTFNATHTFTNPVFKKELRITRAYYFKSTLDSIIDVKDILVEMKSEGEWVKTSF